MLYRSIKTVGCRWHLTGTLALAAVALALAGCVTGRATPPIHTRPVQKASFVIVDQRPGDERTTRWLSDVVDSCAFTVRQYGDEVISSDRFALLTDSLNARLHERLAGKVLLVTHFGIYINSRQRSRAGASIHGEGLAQSLSDYAAGSRFERLCASEEVAEGWLETGHSDTTHSVVSVQITFILDGGTHSVRVFENASSPGTSAEIVSAVKMASDRIIDDLLAKPTVLTAGTQ